MRLNHVLAFVKRGATWSRAKTSRLVIPSLTAAWFSSSQIRPSCPSHCGASTCGPNVSMARSTLIGITERFGCLLRNSSTSLRTHWDLTNEPSLAMTTRICERCKALSNVVSSSAPGVELRLRWKKPWNPLPVTFVPSLTHSFAYR